jgi:hypothetical protein
VAGRADGDAAGEADGDGATSRAGDIIFRIARPRPSLPTNVGIDAVLFPLYGRVAEPGRRLPQIYRLIGLWRRRVAELIAVGWDPAPGAAPAAVDRRVSQLRNCTPPFVAAHPSSSCGLSSICPCCWGREAMRIWRIAALVLFPPDPASGRRPDQPACGLVETLRTHRLPGPDPRLLAAFLADRVRRPPRGTPVGPYYRLHEIQKYPGLGGYGTIAVSADAAAGGPGPWEVAIRQIFAVKPEHLALLQAPEYRRIRIRLVRHGRPDRLDLARAVARLCRFPPWLLRGDPEQVRDSLAARSGLRLGAAFGNFRGVRPGADILRTPDQRRSR